MQIRSPLIFSSGLVVAKYPQRSGWRETGNLSRILFSSEVLDQRDQTERDVEVRVAGDGVGRDEDVEEVVVVEDEEVVVKGEEVEFSSSSDRSETSGIVGGDMRVRFPKDVRILVFPSKMSIQCPRAS